MLCLGSGDDMRRCRLVVLVHARVRLVLAAPSRDGCRLGRQHGRRLQGPQLGSRRAALLTGSNFWLFG